MEKQFHSMKNLKGNSRGFVRAVESGAFTAAFVVAFTLLTTTSYAETVSPIDRQALVTRHNPVIRKLDVDAPLTVGNGGFAFGADITGLQTFAEHYHRWGVPVETQSRWCWVTDTNPNRFKLADANRDFTNADGRVLGYPTKASSPAGDWLRKNPRSHPLGQISLTYMKADGSPLTPEDIQKPEQTLDMWRGVITSKFEIEGKAVKVTTVCHPQQDVVAIRIESELVASGKLSAKIAFPRGHDPATKNTPGLDWAEPESHETRLTKRSGLLVKLERQVENTRYDVLVGWTNQVEFRETTPHQFELRAVSGNTLEFSIGFYHADKTRPVVPGYPVAKAPESLPGFNSSTVASTVGWGKFWRSGAALDFSGSTDPRADKIEARVILSRYLMAAQMVGDVPPQETGLTCSTWYGKHHTEMIWWHTAHFALWGNDDLLAKNLEWYRNNFPLRANWRRAGDCAGRVGPR